MALENSLKPMPRKQVSASEIAKGYELLDVQTCEITHCNFTVLGTVPNGNYVVVPPEYEAQIEGQLR